MKKIFKWTLFILIATAAMAVGMYYLAQYLDSKDTVSDEPSAKKTPKSVSKSFNRHYIKLNLS